MDAADLAHRARTHAGWVPPDLVDLLLAGGHTGDVARLARQGDWFCARALADPEILAPYAATGWWPATEAMATLLQRQGRTGEAVAMARSHPGADRAFLGRLLARAGQAGDAYDLLRPGIDDASLAAALVDVAAPAGRDEDTAALLTARIAAAVRRCDHPGCDDVAVTPFNAVDLLATIRERQGRIDEAIALLHTREMTSINDRDQLADLLARHGRLDELRAYAAADTLGHGARVLAGLLEQRGDIDGAIAVYRQPGLSCDVELAELLARHGHVDEATAVLRAFAARGDDWTVDVLCGHYPENGRAAEGLAYLDGLGADDWEYFRLRLPLLAALGRRDEAITLAQAHPEGGTWYAAGVIAALLADAGRPEQALAVLRRHDLRHDMARLLIGLGRVPAALSVLRDAPASR
ncbi:tetratricopeptide repeat protein [Actinoplanes subglobosus]|uniref:Tetratricopeptide repeat protein n=1 Tax=Actinoplanes subglobosus TaxID=1547892 RepID=A0ABV8IVZ3_9ACTN